MRWGSVLRRGAGRDEQSPHRQAGDEPIVLSRLVLRYAATGVVVLVLVGVVTAFASRRLGTQEAIRDASIQTSLVAGTAVQPVLDDGILHGDRRSLAAVDRVVRGHVLRDPLVRVKIWSRDGTIRYSDEARLIGQRFGLGPEEVDALNTGQAESGLSDLSEPENRYEDAATQLLEVYLPVRTKQGTPLLFEAYYRYQGVAEEGRRIWVRFAPFSLGALVLLELLQLPLALSLARRLRRTQYQREAFLRQAIESTDTERRRIASDLHDGVVQDLAGVAFSLGALGRREQMHGDRAVVQESAESVRDSVRSLRSLLVEIYPPNLNEEGIEGALSDLMARLEPRGIQTSLRVDAPVQRLDLDMTQLVYRAAQEGLRNVVAHAHATRVDVSLLGSDGVTTLEVVDDGRGIGPRPPEADSDGHMGLRSLAGLAESMGASLEVDSTAGKGTTLRLVVPNR
jgi:two-component system, NarL family, sensor kinase